MANGCQCGRYRSGGRLLLGHVSHRNLGQLEGEETRRKHNRIRRFGWQKHRPLTRHPYYDGYVFVFIAIFVPKAFSLLSLNRWRSRASFGIRPKTTTIKLNLTFCLATWCGGSIVNAASEIIFTSGLIWCQAPFAFALSLFVGKIIYLIVNNYQQYNFFKLNYNLNF